MWLARLRIVVEATLTGTRATLAPAPAGEPGAGGSQATDLIDALVQSCTGGRTESFNHETTLNLGARVGGQPYLPAGGHEEDSLAITERYRIR
jgi:hypothetical protein